MLGIKSILFIYVSEANATLAVMAAVVVLTAA